MNVKYMLILDVFTPTCLAKCETEYCILQIIHWEWRMKHYQRVGRAQAEYPDPGHCPQKFAVLGTGVVMSGVGMNSLEFSSMHNPALLASRKDGQQK